MKLSKLRPFFYGFMVLVLVFTGCLWFIYTLLPDFAIIVLVREQADVFRPVRWFIIGTPMKLCFGFALWLLAYWTIMEWAKESTMDYDEWICDIYRNPRNHRCGASI